MLCCASCCCITYFNQSYSCVLEASKLLVIITSAMDIHMFPLEVYERIFRFLDSASHLDFALADKHIYSYSLNILKHHRECYKQYNTCSDLTAETLANLLRIVAVDHIAAWHVRSIQAIHPIVDYQSSHICGETKLRALVDTVQSSMISNDVPVFGGARMRRGDQEALQTALVVLCPQLWTLDCREFFTALKSREDEDEEKDENL